MCPDNEQATMSAVAQQPVSIAIGADHAPFQVCPSGVLTDPCGSGIGHGVLATGCGPRSGTIYWKTNYVTAKT